MALVLNDEQRLLQDSARDFMASEAPVAALRTLRDQRDSIGFAPELWQKMAEMGWASIILPEQYGGLAFGFLGLGVVVEETGRTLAASPLFATAVVGASAILLGGNEAQKEAVLPEVASGNLTLALALEESHHHSPSTIATRLERSGDDSYLLTGEKCFVIDGHSADKLIVVARTSGSTDDTHGLTLLLLDQDAPGVICQRTSMADSRNAANFRFEKVIVNEQDLLGSVDEGWAILEPVLDRGRVAMAAEMMGHVIECFQRTIAYLQEREQFGAKIGSFQALQHRAAHMQSEIELCRSVLLQALSCVDDAPEQLPLMASLAKAKLNELVKLVTNEAVQMHGGIGVTDDLDIGLFLKRSRVTMQIFGDTGFHRDRYATLSGY